MVNDESLLNDASLLKTTISLIQIAMAQNGMHYEDSQFKIKLLMEFGLRMLQKQESMLCQKTLQRPSIESQISIMKWVIMVYSHCLNDYQVNKNCVMKKEKELTRQIWEEVNNKQQISKNSRIELYRRLYRL